MFVKRTGKKSCTRKFAKELVRQMLEKYGTPISTRGGRQNGVLSTGFKEPYTMSTITLNTMNESGKKHKMLCLPKFEAASSPKKDGYSPLPRM